MITTMPTFESFATPIRLTFYWMDVQAIVASLASVGTVNYYHSNAILYRLVTQKQSQLEEGPTITASTLSLVSGLLIGTLSDAC